MNKIISFTILLSVVLFTISCKRSTKKDNGTHADIENITDSTAIIQPRYAQGFKVTYKNNGIRLVELQNPQANEHAKTYKFILIPKGVKTEEVPKGYEKINVPINKAITMTTLQISNFIILKAYDKLSGITSTRHLKDKEIKKRVANGHIAKIGYEGSFDPEIIMGANPDIIFISPFKRGGYDVIKETGITLVPHLGYKESTPLGQAEWIKFIAMFIGKEKEANAIFTQIEKHYNTIKSLAAKTKNRPTVFSGEMHGGNWYAVGGKNFLAQMFRDAGAEYIMRHDQHTGGVPMDYEKMYSIAANADYWRILNSFPGKFSYKALEASDPRNVNFKAFKKKQVIYCNMKQTPYYEQTAVHPDWLLEDLVYIFHPEIMPKNYKPKYYTLLK